MKAREAKPNDPVVYTTMAGFYNRQGDFTKTMEALHKAAELDPKNPQGYQMRRDLLLGEGLQGPPPHHRAEEGIHADKGIEAVDKALSLNPDYSEALAYKNLLLRMQGNEETDLAKRAALTRRPTSSATARSS